MVQVKNIKSAMENNMDFEKGLNKIGRLENSDSNELSFFKKPLDSLEINIKLDEVMKEAKMVDNILIYQEKISDQLSFDVYTNGLCLSFYLTNSQGDHLADFKYKNIFNELCQEHRQVDEGLKDYKINGSMFLQKVEEFLTIMVNKSKNKAIKHFVIDSAQAGVIDWAVKNGYRFKDFEQEERYSRISLGADSDYIITDGFKDGNKYGGYILKQDNLNTTKAFLQSALARGESRDNIDLRDFTERFKLVKDIELADNN